MTNVSFQITASSVAWYGAIVATISVLVSAINLWIDRPRILIKYSWDNYLVTEDLDRDKDEKFVITVINKGRRALVVSNVGVASKKGGGLLVKDGWLFGNKILNESSPRIQAILPQNKIDLEKWPFVRVDVATGKVYFKRIKAR